MAETQEMSDNSDTPEDDYFDEEEIIKYYFSRGFGYNEILLFLEKYHNIQWSYRTLLRRLRSYGLSRRQQGDVSTTHNMVRQRISEMINGPGSSGGYRSI